MTQFPNLFVLGFQKSGTTLLTDLLGSHSDVFIPSIKETYFFIDDQLYGRGYDWYLKEYFSQVRDHHRWVGEGTPFYACDRAAMERLCANTDVANAKFIIVMRDPVKRAYSAYWHIKRLGHEDLSFEEALEAESDRIKASDKTGARWWRHAYKTVSRYGQHIALVQEFIPAENLLILVDSELRDADRLKQRLADYLGVDVNGFGVIEESNKAAMPRFQWVQRLVIGRNPLKALVRKILPRESRSKLAKSILKANSEERSYPSVSPDTARRLRAELEPEILRAGLLSGKDLSQWLAKEGAK